MAAAPGRPPARQRRRRADAEHNRAAILQAATGTLNTQPDASMEDIAKAAGVSRQTIYAHFPSREALLDAVLDKAVTEVSAALEAAGLDDAPPAEALLRLLDAAWAVAAHYPSLWFLPPVSQDEDLARHGPLVERISGLIRRGQESGDFDRAMSPSWLLAAMLSLGRAAEQEVKAGRMTVADASGAVRRSFLRLLGQD